MTLDIPNTFVQTGDPHQNGVERIMIYISGSLVDMLLEIVLEVYTDFVVYERGQQVLCVQMLKVLYVIQ